jgi:hypothetical protein
MITSVILTYDGLADPIECEDLFSYDGSADASTLTTFEAKVDTREMTLSFLGDMFPNMKKLRLNNSIIPSVRDIGSTLVSLRFLSLARCGIASLDSAKLEDASATEATSRAWLPPSFLILPPLPQPLFGLKADPGAKNWMDQKDMFVVS